MEHSVPLDHLPEGLRFPASLGDRISFDAEHKRLVFRGFMSKADFDQLCHLSDDWAFRRPLENLFRECGPDENPAPGGLRRLFNALTHPGPGPSRP